MIASFSSPHLSLHGFCWSPSIFCNQSHLLVRNRTFPLAVASFMTSFSLQPYQHPVESCCFRGDDHKQIWIITGPGDQWPVSAVWYWTHLPLRSADQTKPTHYLAPLYFGLLILSPWPCQVRIETLKHVIFSIDFYYTRKSLLNVDSIDVDIDI